MVPKENLHKNQSTMVQILCEAAYNTAFRVFAFNLADAAARQAE